jgi:hypothetical protein
VFDILVDACEAVGGAESPPMGGGCSEDGEGLGDVLLEPSGDLRGGLLVAGNDVAEPTFGLGGIIGVEKRRLRAGAVDPPHP